MRVGVWGAGSIGSGLVYRLATTPFTSQLLWINRSYEKIEKRVVDIEHGLGFAPTCWRVHAFRQERAPQALERIDLLILTLGAAVLAGKDREDVYDENRRLFREVVIPMLRGFGGLVLVVTNPVDLMARLIHRESGLSHRRVLGLGTVVETARLQASVGSYLSPMRPAREVQVFAVGSHDRHFVPVVPDLGLHPSEHREILDCAREEVVKGAGRVKSDQRSTLHPIVEGTVRVAEAIALDGRRILTVSTLDEETTDGLFYSVPCTVGREGVIEHHRDLLDSRVKDDLRRCQDGLRATLESSKSDG